MDDINIIHYLQHFKSRIPSVFQKIMHSQDNEEFGEDKHKKKKCYCIITELAKCCVFQFSDDHRHGRWPSQPSYGKWYKYISDVVELRHPTILPAGTITHRGIQNHNGDLLFLNVTNNVCHTDVEEANGVHKNIQSGSC